MVPESWGNQLELEFEHSRRDAISEKVWAAAFTPRPVWNSPLRTVVGSCQAVFTES